MSFNVKAILNSVHQVLSNEQGQDIVEYALVVAFLGLGLAASHQRVANMITSEFDYISNILANAT
jgi:Flp pilus assembly pilin Flp